MDVSCREGFDFAPANPKPSFGADANGMDAKGPAFLFPRRGKWGFAVGKPFISAGPRPGGGVGRKEKQTMLTQLTAKSRRLLEAKNRGFLAGFTVLLVAAIFTFTLAGCGDGAGGGGGDPLSGNIIISTTSGGAAVTQANTGATLYAVYSGTEDVTYQWKRGGNNVSSDGTGSSYTPTEAGSYTVTVSADGYESKTSNAVTVTGGGDGKGVDATISLAAVPGQANTFTLTLTGATWKPDGDGSGKAGHDGTVNYTTINYTTRNTSYYISTDNASFGLMHWLDRTEKFTTVLTEATRTSDTVLTIKVVKNTSVSAAGYNTGSGTLALWDDEYWETHRWGSDSTEHTWGTDFLYDWTNEGKRELIDADLGTFTYFGTLTTATGSGTVSITIE